MCLNQTERLGSTPVALLYDPPNLILFSSPPVEDLVFFFFFGFYNIGRLIEYLSEPKLHRDFTWLTANKSCECFCCCCQERKKINLTF